MKKEKSKARLNSRSYTLYRQEDIENAEKIYRYLTEHTLVITRVNKTAPIQYALKKCVEILGL